MINDIKIGKIVVINEISPYVHILKSRQHDRYRSWDHCRRAFRRAAYMRNPQSTQLLELHNCKCNICGEDCQGMNCRLCDNNLALNLMNYLASWGMYRGSSFLREYDYTIHIDAVKILMDKKYLPLFDPELWYNDMQNYIDLVADAFCKIWDHY